VSAPIFKRRLKGSRARMSSRSCSTPCSRRTSASTTRSGSKNGGSDDGDELLCRHSDVVCDFFEKDRGNVLALVKWDSRSTPIRVAKLLVSAALPHLNEAERLESFHDFSRFQTGSLDAISQGTRTACVPTNSLSSCGSPSSNSMAMTS